MSLGPCCLQIGSFDKGTPAGKVEKLGGLDTYITGDRSSKAAILFVADVFGISLVNNKIFADKLAQGVGAAVYLPDYFHGQDLIQQGALEGKNPDVGALIQKYGPREPAWKATSESVAEIKKLQPGAKVGAIGFCWGATSCLHLGSKAAGESQIDAVAFAHPSLIEHTDFASVEKPGLYICPEHDQMFPEEKRQKSWEVLKENQGKKQVLSSFVLLPGLKHGFAARGDSEDEFTAVGQQWAVNLAVSHFSLFLK